ncbi:MAG: acyl-CoA thioesterase/BAAT N-terminal domain-containing protein, partial [Bacteroidota bacterium]
MKKQSLTIALLLLVLVGYAQEKKVELNLQADSELYHKPIHLTASNLHPGAKMKMSLDVTDAREHNWHSEALYIVDQAGQIDLSTQPSVGGNYLGIYPMGLFWSLQSDDYHQIATNGGFMAKVSLSADGQVLAQDSIYRQSTRALDALGIKGYQKR